MPFPLVQESILYEDEVPETHWSKSPDYLREKAAREGREYVMPPVYENSQDTVDRLITESKELRDALNPDPIATGRSWQENQEQQNCQKAVIALKQAVKDLSRYMKAENILGIVRDAVQE